MTTPSLTIPHTGSLDIIGHVTIGLAIDYGFL